MSPPPVLIALFLGLAAPAAADVLSLEGSWRGEGTMISDNIAEQRTRCRMTAAPTGADGWQGQVRCATPQGAVEMALTLIRGVDGAVSGQGTMDAEDVVTGPLAGRILANGLWLESEEDARIELIETEDGLVLQAWENAGENTVFQVLFPM